MRKNICFIFIVILNLTSCQSGKDIDSQKLISTSKINSQLGIAYLQKNEISMAKQKLLLAIDQAPTIPETWYSMGYFQEVTGNLAEAKKNYLQALHVAPGRGDAENNYGTFLCRTGAYDEAVQHFIAALHDPKYLERAGAYENAGLCSLKIPAYTAAMNYFSKALAEDPNHPTSLLELAKLNFKKGNFAQSKFLLHDFQLLASPTVDSLILSIQLARVENQTALMHKFIAQLHTLFPHSIEAQRYSSF